MLVRTIRGGRAANVARSYGVGGRRQERAGDISDASAVGPLRLLDAGSERVHAGVPVAVRAKDREGRTQATGRTPRPAKGGERSILDWTQITTERPGSETRALCHWPAAGTGVDSDATEWDVGATARPGAEVTLPGRPADLGLGEELLHKIAGRRALPPRVDVIARPGLHLPLLPVRGLAIPPRLETRHAPYGLAGDGARGSLATSIRANAIGGGAQIVARIEIVHIRERLGQGDGRDGRRGHDRGEGRGGDGVIHGAGRRR